MCVSVFGSCVLCMSSFRELFMLFVSCVVMSFFSSLGRDFIMSVCPWVSFVIYGLNSLCM